ncbi:hypothetical protein ASPWEDRAFT_52896 [Aspergillus wentii DTO 134E9]|uniref:non-specific serine/threonine protein kinase n=1 Tax=Aspergillus wentii DTO 134E9 TaxID=1073089 RepID=A0A1L9RCW2_ASPWE|nr:uncharacterized protein ASPWEDRAFT_52896 [Aspergillus wentii DTO 134E9]OJJ32751.1 hypothetical protein ASPWEDRAFT_52896 [Aspergillus wentii DTO 134E9]
MNAHLQYPAIRISRDEHATSDHHFQYNWIDGAESLERYNPGGYHPIRYRIVDKLGFGGHSTVWLARDTHLENYVALKVGIADSISHETKSLRALSAPKPSSLSFEHQGRTSIPFPLDEFELHGPNGVHRCYTMSPAQCNLNEASYSRLFPLDVTRALAGGLTMAIAYIHSQGFVHGEYGTPETVPITQRNGEPLPPNVPTEAVIPLWLGKYAGEFSLSDTQVLLSDFGEAFAPALELRRGEDCHAPLPMRAPEARFEPNTPLSYPSDIWSLAVAIWEIIGMKAIFNSELVTADEIVSSQIDVLGPMPSGWWKNWKERSKFFDEVGRPNEGRYVWPSIDEAFEEGVQKYRRKLGMGVFGKEEAGAILELMRWMLEFQPEKRPTAQDVLESEWMVKWALPDFGRSLQVK